MAVSVTATLTATSATKLTRRAPPTSDWLLVGLGTTVIATPKSGRPLRSASQDRASVWSRTLYEVTSEVDQVRQMQSSAAASG